MKQPFSTPGFLWPLLTLLSLLIMLFGFTTIIKRTGWEKYQKRQTVLLTTALIALWIVLITRLSLNGFLSDFKQLPPLLFVAILLPLPIVLIISFSKKGSKLIALVPAQWLVFMQCFRAFVELLIWFAFLSNKLPVQMSIEGKNLDIATSVIALPVGYMLFKRKEYSLQIALAFNVIGLLLLTNVVILSVASLPLPWRHFTNQPSAVLLGSFPFVLLPAVLVPIAYTLHIFSIRQYFIYRQSIKQ